MGKNFFFFTFCLGLLCSAAFAQKSSDAAIYSIRVAAFAKPFDKQSLLKQLGDLGVMRFQDSDKNVRAYLGNYLDRKTAERVLSVVKKRKFNSAYIISDAYDLSYGEGKHRSHTYQVGAFKNLDFSVLNNLNEKVKNNVYILFDKNVYRVSVGLYTPLIPESKAEALAIAKAMGPVHAAGFDRQFRKVPNPSSTNNTVANR